MKWKKDNKLPNTKNVKKKQPPQANNNNNNNNTTNTNNNSTTNAPRPQQPPVPPQQPPMVPLPGRGLHTPHLPLTIEPKDEYGLTEL